MQKGLIRLDGDEKIEMLTRIDSRLEHNMGEVGKYDAHQNTLTAAS